MPLIPALLQVIAYVSRVCGFDTIDSFPPGHQYARTRWNRAYFDIASDLKPEQIERSLCESITTTLLIETYRSPDTPEAMPGLRAVIEQSRHDTPAQRAYAVLTFLGAMPAAF